MYRLSVLALLLFTASSTSAQVLNRASTSTHKENGSTSSLYKRRLIAATSKYTSAKGWDFNLHRESTLIEGKKQKHFSVHCRNGRLSLSVALPQNLTSIESAHTIANRLLLIAGTVGKDHVTGLIHPFDDTKSVKPYLMRGTKLDPQAKILPEKADTRFVFSVPKDEKGNILNDCGTDRFSITAESLRPDVMPTSHHYDNQWKWYDGAQPTTVVDLSYARRLSAASVLSALEINTPTPPAPCSDLSRSTSVFPLETNGKLEDSYRRASLAGYYAHTSKKPSMRAALSELEALVVSELATSRSSSVEANLGAIKQVYQYLNEQKSQGSHDTLPTSPWSRLGSNLGSKESQSFNSTPAHRTQNNQREFSLWEVSNQHIESLLEDVLTGNDISLT